MFAELAKFHALGMEHSWTIRGVYANWTMTVTADPPDDEELAGAGWLGIRHL